MNCQKIQKLLNPYIDKELDKNTASQVEEHLKSCSTCQKEYLQLKKIVSSLDSLSIKSYQVPDMLGNKIMARITKEEIDIQSPWIDNFRKRISIPGFSLGMAGAFAGAAVIFFFAFIFIFNVPDAPALCSAEVQFSLKLGDKEEHVVAIAGDFNGWNPSDTLLEDSDGDGIWTGTLKLEPGRYEYMFVLDGTRWVPDPNAIRYVKDGFGNRNSILEINSCNST